MDSVLTWLLDSGNGAFVSLASPPPNEFWRDLVRIISVQRKERSGFSLLILEVPFRTTNSLSNICDTKMRFSSAGYRAFSFIADGTHL